MTSDSDDALSWEGDEGAPAPAPRLPRGWRAVGRGSDDVERSTDLGTADSSSDAVPDASVDGSETHDADAHDADAVVPAGLSTAMLLTVGVVGGVYLLYSIGWVVGGLRLKPLASLIVADAMYIPWFVLAVAAPALWFLAVWVLTRGRASWIRVSLLLLGVVLLVPWPFVTVGVVGS